MKETLSFNDRERLAGVAVQGLEKAPSFSTTSCSPVPEPCPAETWSLKPKSEDLLRYGLATLPAFNAFKSVVGQLGGVLILHAISARGRIELAALEVAKKRFEEGLSALKARKVPTGPEDHAFL
jgi:hypothetical protein